MGIKLVLSVGPVVATLVTRALLNAADAVPVVAIAVLALIAIVSGAAIGVFWPAPDEPSWPRTRGGG